MLSLWNEYNKLEVGLDEAGRGSLIGSVYVGAVIWSHNKNDYDDSLLNEIKDSKKLSAKKREILAEYIKDNALSYNVQSTDNKIIDKINILNATYKAMHNCVRDIDIVPETILVDGDRFKPYITSDYNIIPHICVPKGDNKYVSIAAASILAKVEHDKHIKQLVKDNPEYEKYDLLNNMGYGTKKHLDAIKKYGITPHHRLKFCSKYIMTHENE